MPHGQRADLDERIADDSDKALVASFRATHVPVPDSLPFRPNFGTGGKEIKLRTNFFPVRVPQGPLYDYHVGIFPMMGVRRMKRRLFHIAEQTAARRQAGMSGKVAHDYSARLISAIRLPQPLAIAVPYHNEDESDPPGQGGMVYTLGINFIQNVNTGNLARCLLPLLGIWNRPDMLSAASRAKLRIAITTCCP